MTLPLNSQLDESSRSEFIAKFVEFNELTTFLTQLSSGKSLEDVIHEIILEVKKHMNEGTFNAPLGFITSLEIRIRENRSRLDEGILLKIIMELLDVNKERLLLQIEADAKRIRKKVEELLGE